MARDDLEAAVADVSKATAMSPNEPRYLDQRSAIYLRQERTALAQADLDHAIALKPGDVDAHLARAALMLHDREKAAALVDLDVVDHAADPAAMERLLLGSLLAEAGQPRRAVGEFDQWIRVHPDDVRKPVALNGRCWSRALSGQELDQAQRDCDAALRARPSTAAFLDSRGLVELRRGEPRKVIADYDAALASDPKIAWSLYGRGIAKLHLGDPAGARIDMDAAAAIRPRIADDAKDYGITP